MVRHYNVCLMSVHIDLLIYDVAKTIRSFLGAFVRRNVVVLVCSEDMPLRDDEQPEECLLL